MAIAKQSSVGREQGSSTGLAVPSERRAQAASWLGLGVLALALAGIFAILLVLARVPGTEALFPTQDFFRVALVIHVDQSVLMWFMAFSGLLYALAAPGQSALYPNLSRIAFALSLVGCLLAAAAPFLGAGNPLLANYVPVLEHSVFLTALLLFGLGALLQVICFLIVGRRGFSLDEPLRIGILTAGIATAMVAVSLIWTWLGLSSEMHQGISYYELLFWPPGHVLQFAYTQVMLVAWLWLAMAVDRRPRISNKGLSLLLILGVVPLLAVPVIQGLYAPDSGYSRLAFTELMRWGNGLSAVPIGLLLMVAWWNGHRRTLDPVLVPQDGALSASMVLFIAGGLLGASIGEVNTVVPAHYHGSIVGVTLALMGLTYHLLPKLGFASAEGRMARWQPWIYGGGQLLHIGGLAASGAMGIQRKTAGAAQGLDSGMVKAFMGVMGLGGLLAVIGGILFVLVVIRAYLHRPR